VIPTAALILAMGVALTPADLAREALAQGDAHYARRAEGAHAGTADPTQVDAAIAAYRRALALDPSSFDARLRLLRAFFFRGGFCGLDAQGEILVFDEAKELAEDTVRRLDVESGRVRGHVQLDPGLKAIPAAEIYLWAAISWGQWAVAHKVSAAWQGAPARIRDMAEAALEIDPKIEQASGHLILGRLHTEAPRIPLLTRWVSRTKGVANLRTGFTLAPQSPANMFFLADALLTLEPTQKQEARDLLVRCANVAARPEYAVEDLHYILMARQRLAELR
jgi:tetratricopeptide (TPR) repeat protein